jgi:hypothetical protein
MKVLVSLAEPAFESGVLRYLLKMDALKDCIKLLKLKVQVVCICKFGQLIMTLKPSSGQLNYGDSQKCSLK